MAALAAGRAVEPGSCYVRGATFFKTSTPAYAWFTRHIIVCAGAREQARVARVLVRFYKLI